MVDFSMSRNAVLSLAVLVLALVLCGLKQSKTKDEAAKIAEPLCRAYKGCRFTLEESFDILSSRNMNASGYQQHLHPSAELQKHSDAAVANLHIQPQVLHVGPNLLPEENVYLWLAKHVDKARFVFVEPNPFVIKALKPKPLFQLADKAQLVQAAVCESDGDGETFYNFDEDSFYAAHPDLPLGVRWHKNKFSAVSSLKKANVLYTIIRNIRPEWKPYSDEVEAFILPEKVTCLSPSTLLQKAGVAAEAVGTVTLDTEGYDAKLLQLFLEVPGFAPKQITFEGPVHESTFLRDLTDHRYFKLLNLLSERGYDVWLVSHDLVAHRAKPGA